MTLLAIWLLIINIVAFVLMGVDKRKAILGARRIPERTLLLAALLGGAAGAVVGMVSFRHKTRHLKFSLGLPLILLIQLGLGFWTLLSRA